MSEVLDTRRTYRLGGELLLKKVGDELLAFDPKTLAVHEFNNTLASIAQLCDGKHSCEQIVVHVAREFELELGDASREVYRGLKLLRDKNLLQDE